MELAADSKDFSSDKGAIGFVAMAIASLVLMLIPIYLIVSPPDLLAGAQSASFAMLFGSIITLFTLALFLKSNGMLFKIPLKVFDTSIAIQPVMSMRPLMVPYSDVSSIELWYHAKSQNRSGCSVLSVTHGAVKSVENFRNKESLIAFAEQIRPVLEDFGFQSVAMNDSPSSAHYSFRRRII